MLRAFRSLLVLLALVPATPVARAAEPSICCWCSPPTCRAASISPSSSFSAKAMPPPSPTSGCSKPSPPAATSASRLPSWNKFGGELREDCDRLERGRRARCHKKFGDQLVRLPRSFAERTSIAGGIDFRHGLAGARPTSSAPHHRRVGRRHQQFRPRRHARPRRGGRPGVTDQRAGDPERAADGLESRAHQSAGRARTTTGPTSSAGRARS